MILDDIKQKLTEVDPLVFYGLMHEDSRDLPAWDYIVFNRTKLKNSANKTSFSDYFEVHIVRENFVPDGLGDAVVAKLQEIPGVKLTGDDGVYDYTVKASTDTVVEMLTLTFVRARK